MSEKEIIEKIKNQNKKLSKEQKKKANQKKFNSIFSPNIPKKSFSPYFSNMIHDQEQRGIKLNKSR